ncbi:BMP family ABC transporter substrate-binding protein [Halalkalibacter alkaliphilus]|uniref:BMP family ABC transporter substrate-binding protein n=1 Tax=Halalkalibacter alkaliphilus TaxID=2917993 RepID=A0A9X2I648_9BACI|nr:BMP family ABC transporter substrate-binding protein [Halalkalibacter alkaliphilus]MCL7748418.1 BMP family ABC transporter substrate-binding protein [Halalkalibacter alkaliphilus]
MQQQSKQSRILLLITMIVAILFICLLILRTSSLLYDSESVISNQDTVKVAIITSDQVNDQSWGGLAYKGQLKIEEKFPVTVSLYSEIYSDELIEATIKETIAENTEVIIGHGREFSNVFTKLAPMYMDTHFVTIHGTSEYENQSVYTFNQGNIEHIAALVASLKSKSKKVGIIDPIEARESKNDFKKGLSHYSPDALLYYQLVGSRDDGKRAVEILEEFIEEGVDVVYSKGNAFNRDVIEHAKKYDIYIIGYLDDQSYIAEDLVLTSVINDVSQAYVSIMEDFFSPDGIPTGTVMLTDQDGVYRLAPLGPMFSDQEKKLINSELEKIHQSE